MKGTGTTRPNTGSTARDHLANERTYLAWLRTGISVSSLGIAIAKFAPQRGGRAVAAGAILLLAGLLVAAYGTWRYRNIGRQLDAGLFTPAGLAVTVTAGVVTFLALIALLVLV